MLEEKIKDTIKQISKLVFIENQNQIIEYLKQFPDLISVIPLAINATKQYFPKAKLILKLYQDPEIEDKYLILCLRLEDYNTFTIEDIEKAEAKFLTHCKDGWLQLTTDFKSASEAKP